LKKQDKYIIRAGILGMSVYHDNIDAHIQLVDIDTGESFSLPVSKGFLEEYWHDFSKGAKKLELEVRIV